jgi:hypothetical protein
MMPRSCSVTSPIGMKRVEPVAFAIQKFGSIMCPGAAGRSSRSSLSRTVCSRQTARIRSVSSSIASSSRIFAGGTSRVFVR